MRVFDRRVVRMHRDRAAANIEGHAFLFDDVADRLAERLLDVKRDFPTAIEIGCRGGRANALPSRYAGTEMLTRCDLSFEMARRGGGTAIVADEEALPFRDACVDLVYSNLSLHWVNDLPGALLQIRRALKPDGLFLAAMLGGGTLAELRNSLMEAESETAGGVSPRVSPFAELRDIAGLLQRAGFALPVADRDTIVVTYEGLPQLLADLRGMGETNAICERQRHFTRRETLMRAATHYASRFAQADGRIPATFDVVFMHGWAPDDSQQQPLRPGSAQTRLATALQTDEISAGEKAAPQKPAAEDT